MKNRERIYGLLIALMLFFLLCCFAYAQGTPIISDDGFSKAYFNLYKSYISSGNETVNNTKDKLLDVIDYYLSAPDISSGLNHVGTRSHEMIGSILAENGVDFDCGTCDAYSIGVKCCIYRTGLIPIVYECVGAEVVGIQSYSWAQLWQCTYGCCRDQCCKSPDETTTTFVNGSTTTITSATSTTTTFVGSTTTSVSTTSTTTLIGGDICTNCCAIGQTGCTVQCQGGLNSLSCSPSITSCQYDGQTIMLQCGSNTQQSTCISGTCYSGTSTTSSITTTTSVSTTSTTTTTLPVDNCQNDGNCYAKYGPCWVCPAVGGNCTNQVICATAQDCKNRYNPNVNWACDVNGCCIPPGTTSTTTISTTTTSVSTTSTTTVGGDICTNCCSVGQTGCTVQCQGGTNSLSCSPSITSCQYDGQTITLQCGTNTQQSSCVNGACSSGTSTTTSTPVSTSTTTVSTTSTTTTSATTTTTITPTSTTITPTTSTTSTTLQTCYDGTPVGQCSPGVPQLCCVYNPAQSNLPYFQMDPSCTAGGTCGGSTTTTLTPGTTTTLTPGTSTTLTPSTTTTTTLSDCNAACVSASYPSGACQSNPTTASCPNDAGATANYNCESPTYPSAKCCCTTQNPVSNCNAACVSAGYASGACQGNPTTASCPNDAGAAANYNCQSTTYPSAKCCCANGASCQTVINANGISVCTDAAHPSGSEDYCAIDPASGVAFEYHYACSGTGTCQINTGTKCTSGQCADSRCT